MISSNRGFQISNLRFQNLRFRELRFRELRFRERRFREDTDFVYLCLDNDKAGNLASERMADLIAKRGILTERLTPERKDWNEDLCRGISGQEVAEPCQISQDL